MQPGNDEIRIHNDGRTAHNMTDMVDAATDSFLYIDSLFLRL